MFSPIFSNQWSLKHRFDALFSFELPSLWGDDNLTRPDNAYCHVSVLISEL